MTMNAAKLARIKWYVGQTLQPDHFTLQEEALLAEARVSSHVRGLPAHGIARLSWNTQLLAQGDLVLVTMTAVFPDGQIIDVPGNAVVQPLDLRAETSSCVSIFLHLLSQTQDATGNRLYEDDPRGVERLLYTLKLSTEASGTGVAATFKLLELKRSVNGTWEVATTHVPPLVQVGTSPFFSELIDGLDTLLTNFRREIILHLADAYVPRDKAAAVRRMSTEIQMFQCMLHDIEQHVYPHPFQLFGALRRLYFEACCFFETEPEAELPAYNHDDPALCLGRVTDLLKTRLGHVRARMRYTSFERQGGSFVITPVPQELFEASEIYFLVQRPNVKKALPIETVKLASPKRLPAVHRLALRGVMFESLSTLPFPHSFGPEIDFYKLEPNEEWAQVLNESAVAFYARAEHEDAKFALFWRA
jgi:type VI secretion system protein ImpJ